MLNIMDVSRWQGEIDWDTVKASGKVDGVMLRALGKRNGKPYVDPTFERNYAECKRVGLPIGVYYYTSAVSKAAADEELAMLKQVLAGKTLDLPVALDAEDGSLTFLNARDLSDLLGYALGVIQGWGVYAMLYTYLSFAQKNLLMGGTALRPYDVWLAAYRNTKPKTAFSYGMWQYTSEASVPGVNGRVDLSRAYKNYPALVEKAGLTKLKGV